MAKQFTLGKKERLKSRKLIEQLFSEGKSLLVVPFKVYYLLNNERPAVRGINRPGKNVQFGVGVSIRNFKKAVHRNRIKRLIKEAYRLQKIALQEKLKSCNQNLIVFFIYTGKELPEYKLVHDKMKTTLQELIKKVEEAEK